MTDETIRGHRLTDQESMALNMPDIPIWTDDGMIIAPISDNGTIPLDSAIESKIQLDAIAYRVTSYYKTHDEEIQKSDDDIDFVLRMIGKATGFIAEAGCSTGHVHTNTATEMQALSKIVWLTQQSNQCLLMAANVLINKKERMQQADKMKNAIIEAAEKAKAYSEVHPPIDYMDIGKKMGVSNTQGMELNAAMTQAYNEWKEKYGDGH